MEITSKLIPLTHGIIQEEVCIETYDFIKFCKFLELHLNCTKPIPHRRPTKYLFDLEKTRKLNTVNAGKYTAVLTRHYRA